MTTTRDIAHLWGDTVMAVDEGTILHVSANGLAVVESTASHEQFPFTFDKIKGYCGQPPAQLGLEVGRHVRFSTDGTRVQLVEILKRTA